jgi:predicted hydrocarbon binding protein
MTDPTQNPSAGRAPGEIKAGGLRYLLVRPETLAEIQKGVEDRLGPKAAEYLYTAGASWAVSALKRLKGEVPEDGAHLPQALCRHATELGWGRWELLSFDPEKHLLVVRVFSSPFAAAYGQSDLPACHLIAGAISGLGEFMFNMPAATIEEGCAAQGSPHCTFKAVGHDVVAAEAWKW